MPLVEPAKARSAYARVREWQFLLCCIILILPLILVAIPLLFPPSPLDWLFFATAAGFALMNMFAWSWWGVGFPTTRINCPQCGKDIASSIPWRCGYCDASQTVVWGNSIFNKCGVCKRDVFSYICHHCGKEVTLNGIGSSRNTAATAVLTDTEISPQRDKQRADIEEERLALEREREHQVKITRLEAELAQETARLSMLNKKPKPAKERLEEELREFCDNLFGAEESADKLLERVEREFKYDPEKRERWKNAIESWKIRHIPD